MTTERTAEQRKIEELRFHFTAALSSLATKGRNGVDAAWKNIVSVYKERPYHNLELIYNDLHTAREFQCSISNPIIIASVLKYYKFHPLQSHVALIASKHAEFFLSSIFGCLDKSIEEIKSLIMASSQFMPPSPNEEYGLKLMYDMKMSRLASKYFEADRSHAYLEFSAKTSNLNFYRSEQALLTCYNSHPELFALNKFKVLTPIARENMGKRFIVLNGKIKFLENTN